MKRGSELHLTKMDDEIFDHLKTEMPDFDPAVPIVEDEMKSKQGKERWRNFVQQYKGRIDDFDFGTMLRANPKDEYTQDNTIFGTHSSIYRYSFLALLSFWQLFECSSTPSRLQGISGSGQKARLMLMLFRNRAGLNDWVYEKKQTP